MELLLCAGGSGGSGRGSGGCRSSTTGSTTSGITAELLNATVQGLGNLVNRLLSNALADGGNLGNDGTAEVTGSRLLLLELVNGDGGGAKLVKLGLLGDQVINRGLDSAGQATG